MAIQAIIFDFDGVIIDTMTTLVTSWQEEYVSHQVPFDAESLRVCIGMAKGIDKYEWLSSRANGQFDEAVCRDRRRSRESELVEALPLLDGVLEWLNDARELGLSTAIASSSARAWVRPHLARLGVLDGFDAVCCGDEVPRLKPAPDVYAAAARQLGVSTEECLAVEDSDVSMQAAIAAGCRCVVVPNAITEIHDFDGSDFRLNSLAERPLWELLGLMT